MKIEFVTRVGETRSVFSDFELLEQYVERLAKEVTLQLKGSYNKSQTKLVVTVVANPSEAEKRAATERGEKLWTMLGLPLASELDIWGVENHLGRIAVPQGLSGVLVVFDIQPFEGMEGVVAASEARNSAANRDKPDADDEMPQYELHQPKWSLQDVMLTDAIRVRIVRDLAIIKNRDLIFNQWGFGKIDKSTKSVLCFYGAPGTGKTMTAEAVANYLGKPIVHSSYAQIESKYVGEGAKNLHAIFRFAEEHDAVLFFDEADSFLSNRIASTDSASDKHYNRMSNELFQLLEDFNGCVVFATNLLTDVDSAFKSRIIDSIRFELPDKDQRIELIKRMLPDGFPIARPLDQSRLDKLSERIKGFSGRDIRKSMLLSLSGAALKHDEGAEAFTFDDIEPGFDEVLNYKRQMDMEQGILPVEPFVDIINRYEEQNESGATKAE